MEKVEEGKEGRKERRGKGRKIRDWVEIQLQMVFLGPFVERGSPA